MSSEELKHALLRDLTTFVTKFTEDSLDFFCCHTVLGSYVSQDALDSARLDELLTLVGGGLNEILLEARRQTLRVTALDCE